MNLSGAGCWASVPEDRKRLYWGMHLPRYTLKKILALEFLCLKWKDKLWTYAKVLELRICTLVCLKTAWSMWAGVHLKIDHVVVEQQQQQNKKNAVGLLINYYMFKCHIEVV